MARLSVEHFRDQTNSSKSIGRWFSSIFKGRRSLPDGSLIPPNTNGGKELLKPGFEKVGLFPEDRSTPFPTNRIKHKKRPSSTVRPSAAASGELKRQIPHALDMNSDPAVIKTNPTSKIEIEQFTPLLTEADEVLLEGQSVDSEANFAAIEEESSTAVSDCSTRREKRTVPTVNPITRPPTLPLNILANSRLAQVEVLPAVKDKLGVPVKPSDSISNVSTRNPSPARGNLHELLKKPSSDTASSWATATGPNSADVAERLGLKEVLTIVSDESQADGTSAIQAGVTLIILSILSTSMILVGPKKVVLLIFYVELLHILFHIILEKLGWNEWEVAYTIRRGFAQGIWLCVPVVNWIAYQIGYLLAPIVEASVDGFTVGYERALFEQQSLAVS